MSNANTTKVKRPFEKKAAYNRKLLNNFFCNNPEEYRTLISALLSFAADSEEKETGYINIAVGQRTDNGFNVMLNSFTDKPVVKLGNWNNIEPTMAIFTTERKIHNIICSLNLTLISDLETEVQITENYDRYVLTFRYDDAIDYQIIVMCFLNH